MPYKQESMFSGAFQIICSGIPCRERYDRSVLVSGSFGRLALGFSWIVGIAIGSCMVHALLGQQAMAQQTCPSDVEPLTELLIRDLPSYANRQLRSVIPLDRTLKPSRIIIAGRPEFAPLPLAPGQPAPSQDADPAQVFISTLERQYVNDRAVEIQQYHWLFLTRSPSGWRLAFMFTRTGSATPGTSPTPPRDSSDGAIAQAIKTWLRDCRAGLVNVTQP